MQSPGKREARPAAPVKAAAPGLTAVPFAVGEKLEYQVLWGVAAAATAQMLAVERRAFFGKEAWHFQVRASTVNPARLLYQLDDQFDSYTEARSLVGLRFEMYIHEQGKKRNDVHRLVREGEPAPADGPGVRVPAGTCDPVGLIYALRAVDWARTPKWNVPVFDGKKLYDLRAERVAENGSVTAGGVSYTVSRIELRPWHRGKELVGTRFWVSLANNAGRTPVLMEAEVTFGKFRIELQKKAAKP